MRSRQGSRFARAPMLFAAVLVAGGAASLALSPGGAALGTRAADTTTTAPTTTAPATSTQATVPTPVPDPAPVSPAPAKPAVHKAPVRAPVHVTRPAHAAVAPPIHYSAPAAPPPTPVPSVARPAARTKPVAHAKPKPKRAAPKPKPHPKAPVQITPEPLPVPQPLPRDTGSVHTTAPGWLADLLVLAALGALVAVGVAVARRWRAAHAAAPDAPGARVAAPGGDAR